MPQWSLRVRSGQRDLEILPREDEALGRAMFDRLIGITREKGPPRPALVALHPERVEQFDMRTVQSVPEPHRTRLMASIVGRGELECGVLAGTMRVARSRGRQVQGLVVFIEWPDNRWWTAWQPLGEDGQPVEQEPVIRRAVEGWPCPKGVGGWFARVRREGLNLRVQKPLASAQPGLDLVH